MSAPTEELRSAPKKHLVIILGAGASLPCGLPSTEELTACAEQAFEESYVTHLTLGGARKDRAAEAREIAQKLLAALRDAYGDIWNFEVLLHCVRHMTAFAAVVDHGMPGAPKSSLPVSTVFGEIQGRFREALKFTILNWSFFAIVRALHKLVASRMTPECASYRDAMTATQQFLRRCAERFTLTVVDLNYDVIADNSGVSWVDGFFEATAESAAVMFDPARWQERLPDEHRLVHLHGSVLYGLRADEARHDPWEVARYENTDAAYASLKMTGSAQTMIGGVDHGAYALISGLDKSGSLAYNPRPFGHYFLAAADALCRCNRLLVVGYGGRDPHLNTWIGENADIHGDRRRAVAVQPLDWHWQGQHRRGENIMLRLLFGRALWDRGGTRAAGVWQMNEARAGPTLHVSLPTPAAYERTDAILDHLDGV